MKLLKCISLFILYPLTMFAIGFAANMMVMEYFYPGESTDGYEAVIPDHQCQYRICGAEVRYSERTSGRRNEKRTG